MLLDVAIPHHVKMRVECPVMMNVNLSVMCLCV